MTKSRTKARKLADKRRMQLAGLPELAGIPRRADQGKARMAQLKIEAIERDADVPALEARCRQSGIEVIVVPNPPEQDTQEHRKLRHRKRLERSAQLRDMRAVWRGCEAGRAMASVTPSEPQRAELWAAILHMRRTQVAYDRAIGAPSRHAQCLRIMLPLDAMHADASTPAIDLRSEAERHDQAVSAWKRVQGWLGQGDKVAASLCKRVVIDDERCPDAALMVAALWCVADGLAGRKIVYRNA